ncbi:GDSL-type esterase/lipase family protein [Streptomyces sp. NPDC020747]|uniref:GDSL-type esterase/lipase family protein n=1 Tax=Streptomyces sp. NPDC020747 TaxID=3365086 RepID=UPI0037B2B507
MPTQDTAPVRVGRTIEPTDPVLTYRGAVSLQQRDGWLAPWRAPHEEAYLYFPRGKVGRLAHTSGIRVCLRTDSPWISCRYEAVGAKVVPGEPTPPDEPALLDVLCDDVLVRTVGLEVDTDATLHIEDLPAGEKLVELWLPTLHQFRIRELRVAQGASLAPDTTRRPRWIHYGDSIDHGRGAASPSRTWLALAARAEGLDLQSMSFAGDGSHLQPMFARLARDLPADLISLRVGMSHFMDGDGFVDFPSSLIGFVQIIRERRPDTTIVLGSSVYSPFWDTLPNTPTAADYRTEVARVTELLRRHGDENVHFLDGMKVWGPEYGLDLYIEKPDRYPTHPNAPGHELFAASSRREMAAIGVLPVKG